MQVVVFEDDLVDRLTPITWTRPAYSITCAAWRLGDLCESLGHPITARVRPWLVDTESANHPDWKVQATTASLVTDEPTLVVNARVVANQQTRRRLEDLVVGKGRPLARNNCLLASYFPGGIQSSDPLNAAGTTSEDCSVDDLPTLDYPHDVLRQHDNFFSENLEALIAQQGTRQIADGVFAADGVRLSEQTAIDTTKGPIVLGSRAVVLPFSYLKGPLYVGDDARINEHASIKDGVCLGHTVRVGGEVSKSIIEPYSNKSHSGFLGDSYLGSWVNLGAGTTNSNLKNTYGPVRVVRGGEKLDTGMQFLGCVIGDHTKSAINASIFTGLTIGVASGLYGTVTENVGSFVNFARSLGLVTEQSLAAVITTQKRAYERRGLQQESRDIELLNAVFERTKEERLRLETGPPQFLGMDAHK